MTWVQRLAVFAGLAGISFLAVGAHHNDAGYVETDLVVNKQVGNVPTLTDGNGIVHVAKVFDPHLVNPWGISESTGSPFWVSDNGDGTSSLFATSGQNFAIAPLLVSIPSPADALGNGGTPTGQAFNSAGAPGVFPITGVSAAGTETTMPAVFLFATEDGTILGWNPGVLPARSSADAAEHARDHRRQQCRQPGLLPRSRLQGAGRRDRFRRNDAPLRRQLPRRHHRRVRHLVQAGDELCPPTRSRTRARRSASLRSTSLSSAASCS